MANLENKTIKILESNTEVFTAKNTSRINSFTFDLKNIIADYGDRVFFENVIINGESFRPMLYTKENTFLLENAFKKRSKTIVVKKYEILN